jgi:HEAT repeat protein
VVAALLVAWFAGIGGTACGQADPAEDRRSPAIDTFDYTMYRLPELPTRPPKVVVSNAAIPLWLQALDRPESRVQRMAIDTFAVASRRGMAGLAPVIPRLVEKLEDPDADRSVRLAAARALIAMDARQHADVLASVAAGMDVGFQLAVESALARWGAEPMVATWLNRLGNSAAEPAALQIAMQGLGNAGADKALPALLELVRDRGRLPAVRLAAARSAGQLPGTGATDTAAELISQGSPDLVDQLAAVELLAGQDGAETERLLETLLAASESAVQAAAIERLYEIDPSNVLPWIDRLIDNEDSSVRWTLAKAIVATRQKEQVETLARLLDDVHTGLRQYAAAELVGFAEDTTLRDAVLSATAGVLDGDSWRGCEQAVIVMVNLDHEPAGDRMVDLLRHPRGEVMKTAAWGLRRLALPKHLPAMLGRAAEVYDEFQDGQLVLSESAAEEQLAQLFMAFGQLRYDEAETLMRSFIPRNFDLGEKARAAAIWSLGWLHEDAAEEDLARRLTSRLNDIDGLIPELDDVRRMSAISLGRMKAESALPSLRKHASPRGDATGTACWWAIERITGETPPPLLPPGINDYRDWFLVPLEQ